MEIVRNLTQLIYVSTAIQHFTESELLDLLKVARTANAQHGITGLLLYRYGNFMQVIEGESQKIEQLIENIKRDDRHSNLAVILKEDIIHREFSDWTMGFREISEEEVEGFSDFFKGTQSITQLQQGRAKTVLLSFKG